MNHGIYVGLERIHLVDVERCRESDLDQAPVEGSLIHGADSMPDLPSLPPCAALSHCSVKPLQRAHTREDSPVHGTSYYHGKRRQMRQIAPSIHPAVTMCLRVSSSLKISSIHHAPSIVRLFNVLPVTDNEAGVRRPVGPCPCALHGAGSSAIASLALADELSTIARQACCCENVPLSPRRSRAHNLSIFPRCLCHILKPVKKTNVHPFLVQHMPALGVEELPITTTTTSSQPNPIPSPDQRPSASCTCDRLQWLCGWSAGVIISCLPSLFPFESDNDEFGADLSTLRPYTLISFLLVLMPLSAVVASSCITSTFLSHPLR
ncbi:unnamed protein product [Pleuronectes platessa]|uniref:Uncharacterized protein n=1 Tax=Pleuronectes platessa TaxID=8262 RepID=A0A9N7TT11_PLEPL|nr:unnamed protein product [Pleuronectes platessa]